MNKRKLFLWFLDLLIAIVCIVCIILGYQVWQQWSQKNHEKQAYKDLVALTHSPKKNYLEVDWDKLKKEAPDVVGWLYIPNTNINYPIVQGDNNDFYLNHSYTKQADQRGTIFLDNEAKPDFSERNSLIYGHNGYHGVMTFAELEKFLDKDFFKKNKYLYLLTPNGNYRCLILAMTKVTVESPLYQTQFPDDLAWTNYLAELDQAALYKREAAIGAAKKIITLSTCDETYGIRTKHRYLLQAALKKYNKKIPIAN